MLSGKAEIYANAGDTLSVQVHGFTGTPSTLGGTAFNWISFKRNTGPVVVAATESVSMSYSTSTTNIPNTSTPTQITFTAKQWDSHNAFSTNTYTVPVSGVYLVSAGFAMAGAVDNPIMYLYKNGTNFRRITQNTASAINPQQSSCVSVRCVAGDTLAIYVQRGGGTANVALDGVSTNNYFSVDRVGN
jgi:hypothetical protein